MIGNLNSSSYEYYLLLSISIGIIVTEIIIITSIMTEIIIISIILQMSNTKI